MLFKFLGNSDAPDWIMSELNTLSLVSSVRIKFILRQIFNLLTDSEVNFDEIYKHLTDAKLNESQTRSILALLSFIIQNAVRFNAEPEDLAQELQQLGTPISHTSTIIRFYRENRNSIRKYMRSNHQRFSRFDLADYQAEIILKQKDGTEKPKGLINLWFKNSKNNEEFSFSMGEDQADDLIRELHSAIDAMRSTSK